MKLEDRVKRAVEAAMQEGKSSCSVISDTFECNTKVVINMSVIFERAEVISWVEQLNNNEVKIWLEWGPAVHRV